MSKRAGLGRIFGLLLFAGTATTITQSSELVEISSSEVVVTGVVTTYEPELGFATVGDTVVYVGDVVGLVVSIAPGDVLSLVGIRTRVDGLVWASAVEVQSELSTQSITGTGRRSITGTGRQSITGTGKASITGTGRQSITGTGKLTVTGTEIQSITGTGIQRQSITGTGR